MGNFKQELATIETQIVEKIEEVGVLKQYKKSTENAMRIKQKVVGKKQALPALPEKYPEVTATQNHEMILENITSKSVS